MQFKNKEIKAITFDKDGYPSSVWAKNEGWTTIFSKYHNILLVESSEKAETCFLDDDYWLLDKTFDDDDGITEITDGNPLNNPPIHQDILQAMLDLSCDIENYVYCDVCDSYFPDSSNTIDCGHAIWIDDEYEWGGIGGELRPQDIKPKMQVFLKELGVKGSINLLEDLIFHLPMGYITEDKLAEIWDANEYGNFKSLTDFEDSEDGDTKHCLAWIKSLSAKDCETNPRVITLKNTTVNWIYEFLITSF